jgi:hypothetical protein
MIAARTLIEEAAALGARVYMRDGQLKVAFRGEPPRDLLDKLRAHKPEIVRELAPSVASLDERRASVERLRDDMAAENERRRGWMSASPYDSDGNLTIRSILTGELTTIRLAKRGRT